MRKPKISRQDRLANEIALFTQRTGRKAPKGGLDPNDRKLDHELEHRLKHTSPMQIDELTRVGDE